MEDEEDVIFLDPDSDDPVNVVRPPYNTDFGCLFSIIGGIIVGIIYLWYRSHKP